VPTAFLPGICVGVSWRGTRAGPWGVLAATDSPGNVNKQIGNALAAMVWANRNLTYSSFQKLKYTKSNLQCLLLRIQKKSLTIILTIRKTGHFLSVNY